MEFSGIGGGIMLAVAAALWLVYLVPNWLRRREYLATERNAVRLQQTIRILAETAEIPAAVRAEREALMRAEAARQLARQLRIEGPVSVGRPVVHQTPVLKDTRSTALRRLRRSRALAALMLLGSLVTIITQVVVMLVAGVVTGAWLVLGAALLAGTSSFTLLARVAEAIRARTAMAVPSVRRTSLGAPRSVTAYPRTEWTPMPVPKPLYLSRPLAPTVAAVDPSFELAVAAASAQRSLREVEAEAAPIRVAAQSTSRFASMGIVDDAANVTPDLDAVLARRRAAS